MNLRFQNAEIKLVSEQYANNDLYKAVCSVGSQLETELAEFGLCPEECFMEVLELLSAIADKGEDILPEIDTIWHRKYNEYRRFDRKVDEEEIRKVVGIIFGFTVLAVDSSAIHFYRMILTQRLTATIANYKFNGWVMTLTKVFSVPLPDGWFDAFIGSEPEEENETGEFAEIVDTLHKKIPSSNIIVQLIDKQYNSSCQQFMGKMQNPKFTIQQNDETI